MKNLLLLTLSIIFTTTLFGQKMKFKVAGVPDTTVNLVKYVGKNLMYADTAFIKNGIVEFNGAKHKPGIMGLWLPDQKYFEFINNKEEIYIETDSKDFIANMKVKKSEENKVFLTYIQYLEVQKKKANALVEDRKAFQPESDEYKALTDKVNDISKEVLVYQQKLISENPAKLVAKIVKMSLEIEIPKAPVDENGKQIDEAFNYHYYFAHFWDNVDFKDDRLLNTSIFGSKFTTYFSDKMMPQHWDTIIKYAYKFIDQLDPKSDMFEYAVTQTIMTSQKSKIMGMDKVYVYLLNKYYCTRNPDGKSPAYWMEEDKLKTICEDMPGKLNTVVGVIPPNISLRDTTDKKWADFYSLNSEYKVLYFWSPDCGHCKKITPKLEKLYTEKLKGRNVEVFGVCKAMDKNFELWKTFIRENNLTFTNVAVTQSLFDEVSADPRKFIPKYTSYDAVNYHITYDIYATPRVFLLDKDNRIIAKGLTISQLEDFLDKLQKVENAPKLFPPDPEEEETMKD